jgi:HTH-type transcriptional regulator, glycine betaine synthesis regulator
MDNKNYIKYSSNQDIRRHFTNACIQWSRIRGYSDSTGLLRGLVTLAKEPMSLDELVLETGYSKSTVSSNMNLLENLGLVKRIVIPGDKRHIYETITNPDVIMANMLDTIEKEIRLFSDALDRTENELVTRGEFTGSLSKRVAELSYLCEQGKKRIDVLRKKPLNAAHESSE